METTSPFLSLADSIHDLDQRQNALLAILEQQPATAEEAQRIVDRVVHTARNNHRKRDLQLVSEPPQEEVIEVQGIHAAIDTLPADERELLYTRYVKGDGLKAIALARGKSVSTTHDDMKRALNKLLTILSK